jgi:5-methylcytosine-specific restriction endonuclease McrA
MPIRGGKAYRQATSFKARIRERDDHKCQLCGCGLGEVCDRHWAVVSQLDVAHIVPFKDGGLSTPYNMRVVCHPCNKREGYGTQAQRVVWPYRL